MQLSDVLCYVLLTITVIAAYLQPAQSRRYDVEERQQDRRLHRRESSMLISDFHNIDNGFQRPKIIYRRLSKQRYGPPKSRYGSVRPKYTSSKPRKPVKKPRGKYNTSHPKHNPSTQKKKIPKSRYGPTKTPSTKPAYRPPKKTPGLYYFPRDSIGFGEPPANYDYQAPRTTYGEPPIDSYSGQMGLVDSYGAPARPTNSYKYQIKPTDDSIPTGPSDIEPSSHFETQDYGFDNEYQSWKNLQQNQHQQEGDNENSYTNKLSTFIVPDMDIYVTPAPDNDGHNLNGYQEIYNLKENSMEQGPKPKQKLKHKYNKNKKLQYFSDNKVVNRPWKGHKIPGPDHEIIVGGQYAEPPARYLPRFQPTDPGNEGEDDFAPPTPIFTDASTSANSPYVNYKNSNLAFSPQNLNDAFSIVDK